MKNNINNLYLAKCRRYLSDLYTFYFENGVSVVPVPDYVDYYTILLIKDNKITSIFEKDRQFKYLEESDDVSKYYSLTSPSLIIEIEPLINYIETYNDTKLTNKEIDLIYKTIHKTKQLKNNYGYCKK